MALIRLPNGINIIPYKGKITCRLTDGRYELTVDGFCITNGRDPIKSKGVQR
jgi:hypothetical protein